MKTGTIEVDETLHGFMKELNEAQLLTRDDLTNIPKNGAYVFYQNNTPMYVGISGKDRMKTRIQEHSRPSSDNSTAPFAFNMAKKEAIKRNLSIQEERRNLEKDPEFSKLFLQAKKEVSQMKVKVVEIEDPNFRALFEIYAVLVLNTTEFNSFETH